MDDNFISTTQIKPHELIKTGENTTIINNDMQLRNNPVQNYAPDEHKAINNDRYMYKIYDTPDETVFGKEYKAQFKERITNEERKKKIANKRSRLFVKHKNADLIQKSDKDFRIGAYDTLNRAITKQAFRMDKEDYNDLAMFMKDGKDEYNIKLVNLYMGKSVKKGPGGLEGQDVHLALGHMAKQLFAIDISALNFKNDTEMSKCAPMFEKLSGQVAAFDRLSAKHNYMSGLNEDEQKTLNERLEVLRSVAAYYAVRKEIICDKYYKTHYNDEISLDVGGASADEQRTIGEKLVKSLILGRNMLRINGIDITKPKYKGNIRYTSDKSLTAFKSIYRDYTKDGKCKEITNNVHVSKDSLAMEELLRCQKKLESLNREAPLKEQQNIQSSMKAVQNRAFAPVQRPENRTGILSKLKNRLMLGYRFLLRGTAGVVSAIVLNLINGTEAAIFEPGRRKEAQEKRDHESVPGRKGEFFREEVVRKNEKGEDLDVYSDVRRGPLVWEKLTAGDPEEPPEVTIMMQQSKRGSRTALKSFDMGHAMIGLSYSRYNKTTKRKERYQLRMGFYPGGGLIMGTALSMFGGATIPGRLSEDTKHHYDISRRYQVKPGDINKILRASEKYADKGYNYFSRNCTTFVVDMAKLINLPVSKEFKEDEMEFEGGKGFLAQTLFAGKDSGIYMGANAISSRMNKIDLDYLNFGQNRYTKEELDRYYKTIESGELVKKGYSPSVAGETLRDSNNGELSAFFKEHKNIKLSDLRDSIAATGSELWAEIIKLIPEDKINAFDDEAMTAMIGVGDADIYLLREDEKTTPDQVREAHKKVRNAMKIINKYYAERLGNDARLNPLVMKLLSLYETALLLADEVYDDVVSKAVKGDVGISRYNFNHLEQEIYIVNDKKEKIKTSMSPGEYEGYLLAHKTPEEAIYLKARYDEIMAIPKNKRTDEHEKEFKELLYYVLLAEDFAKANRYILEKDDFDEKDIKYAFHELPRMERSGPNGDKIGGDFMTHYRPSFTYQGVIFEKIFGGFAQLHLEKIPGIKDKTVVLDRYITEGFEKNREIMKTILKWYIEGKDKASQGLAIDFLSDMEDSCISPAYHNFKSFDHASISACTMIMSNGANCITWLTNEIDLIKNAGGIN
ncbi:MAG: hypothetical protein IJ054_09245 [Lachnospiraceae bacterium]|nr:hypothetical protein [Lachnospiraceae bacterium]MBQ9609391.1 hypothetical protein [Lachnospiraceae bacterium]